jgi:hypothetical protein
MTITLSVSTSIISYKLHVKKEDMQTRKRAVIENDNNFLELTSFRKPRKEKHALFHNDRIDFDETFVDQRTGIQMKICLHPMQSLGAGAYRGFGLYILQRVEKDTIFAISEEPLHKMDLVKYSAEDYSKNGWIIFGNYASKRDMTTMFANTRAPINEFEIETANCELRDRQLPPSFRSWSNVSIHGKFSYLKATRVIKANSWAIVTNYGKGKECLRWGQEPTLRKQQILISRYNSTSIMINTSKQKGNLVCEGCGELIPRSAGKAQAHKFKCSQALKR